MIQRGTRVILPRKKTSPPLFNAMLLLFLVCMQLEVGDLSFPSFFSSSSSFPCLQKGKEKKSPFTGTTEAISAEEEESGAAIRKTISPYS